MKKIILLISIIWLSLFSVSNTFAEGTTIKVSVPIDFSSVFNWSWVTCLSEWTSDSSWTKWPTHYCEVPKGTTWFQVVMAWIIKFFVFIASLSWVLFIVLNWIMYSMAWMNDSFKTEAKDRITKTLIWIILLLMSWVILNILAPWVYG